MSSIDQRAKPTSLGRTNQYGDFSGEKKVAGGSNVHMGQTCEASPMSSMRFHTQVPGTPDIPQASDRIRLPLDPVVVCLGWMHKTLCERCIYENNENEMHLYSSMCTGNYGQLKYALLPRRYSFPSCSISPFRRAEDAE